MRILIFNTLYTPYRIGGAEISVQDLAENLSKKNIVVGVVTLGENQEKKIINGISIWRLKLQNIFWPFEEKELTALQKLIWHIRDVNNRSYKRTISQIFEEFKPDIVHTNNLAGFSVNIWSIAALKKIKVVHTLRDYYLQCPRTTKFKGKSLCTKKCIECNLLSLTKKKKSQKVHCVIGISSFILTNHISNGYFLNSKRKVISNGFKIPIEMNKNFKLDNLEEIQFGFIGQINPSKGLELLIESLSLVKSEFNWVLHVAGKIDKTYQEKLTSKLLKGKVFFHGYVDPAYFFKKIDTLVVPSIWEEPFGRVVLEGLIYKKPILGSNRGGIPEILGEKNRAFIFEPEKRELSQLLAKVIEFPRILEEFSFDKKDLDKFSLETSTKSYINTFHEVLND
ncbi:glycosyltransferase family 4 protein [Flagellimonas meridianipacifica]|uniref:Glycosyltransferase involved in cell wall biosynthesis n=1 Tax=Flagellimonas meridianipacifica TaxID=1080225 RepID=A0A2T0MH93_9FLAO|nr:glycosyltransferase family 4 protein [Allomuricauda pacifica]PRX56934.1 glycosyltransferase involved in cell wall biosynthesis [Allomuricauda pacifica]